MRGEKQCQRGGGAGVGGSPPRARGEEGDPSPDNVRQRITPACAGRSREQYIFVGQNRDHPRVRGEKGEHHAERIFGLGSPPRARGEAEAGAPADAAAGITPACAGRSHRRTFRHRRGGDHPRVRGEKRDGYLWAADGAGSPPRARGEATPASCSSHPQGSPPRARGEVAADHSVQKGTGITPACAGRRHICDDALQSGRDHPRVRGEKTKKHPVLRRFFACGYGEFI